MKATVRDTGAMPLSPRTRRLFQQWLAKSDPYAYYKSSESLVNWSDSGDLLQRFIDLRTTKWYVYGEANKNLPVIKLLDGVPKIEIPHSGHFMMVDNPEDFYSNLRKVLAE